MTTTDRGWKPPASTETATLTTDVLLGAGVLAGPLFVTVFLIEGATRFGYDPMRMPVSLLSTGDDGWTQAANFIVDGLLLLAFAVGLYRALDRRGTPNTVGPLLLALVALGIVGAGLFSTDPAAGYPWGVPPPEEPSTQSVVHDVASLLVFGVLPLASFVLARGFARWGDRRWAIYSALTALVLAIGCVLLLIGSSGAGPWRVAGLIQRCWIVVGWGWIMLLALHLLLARDEDGVAAGAAVADPARQPPG
jgi:hypothetical protein